MVAYSIWNRSSPRIEPHVAMMAKNLTLHMLQLKFSGATKFDCDHSLTRLLISAQQRGAKWCVALLPGQMFRSADFFTAIEAALQSVPEAAKVVGLSPGLMAFRCDKDIPKGVTTPDIELRLPLNFFDLDVNGPQADLLGPELLDIGRPDWTLDTSRSKRCSPQTFVALEHLHYQCRGYGNEMFVFNTENYRAIEGRNKRNTLDALFTLASGFKDLFLLSEHGVHASTQIQYFDICSQSLLLKRFMFETWDGRDFAAMMRRFTSLHSEQLASVVPELNIEKLSEQWLAELAQWGGESQFVSAFRMAQNLSRTYTQLDLVRNPDSVANMVRETPGNQFAVWYSNCFNFTPTLATFEWNLPWIEGQGLQFLGSLARLSIESSKQIVLYGPDVMPFGKSGRSSRLASELYF